MGSTCSRIILNQKFINPKTFKTNVRRFSGLSYIHNVGKDPLKAQTIGQLFEESASKYGDKIAITSVYDNRKITFEEIFKESNKLAAGLHSLGLKKGDRVGLWAPNIIEWVTMMVAISQAGLITVALNPIDHQKNELEYFINKAGLKALVCPDEYKKLKFYDTLCSFLPELEKSDPGKLRSKRVPTLESVITISKNLYRGTYNYNEILNMCDEEAVNNLVKNNIHCPDAISNIQYTSGTTGISKAACVGHFQQVNNSYHIGKRSGLNPNENICVQVPFFHAFGTVVCVLAAQHFGSMLTLPSPVYNSSANLKALEDEKCTSVYGTPTMFVDLLNLQKKEKKKINVVTAITGGAPCSPQLFKDMKNILNFKKTSSVYGMTEMSAVAFQSLPIDEDEHKIINTVGCIGDHLEAKVIDDNGNTVPMGARGELCVRGYNVMLGYWNDREKTNEVLGSDRWFRTGDLFALQKDGYGKIIGRLKDVIIRGGENIFPKEIEDVINEHPDVLESQVIGLSHERLGEEVYACVILKRNQNLNYNNIIEFCQEKLASYKIPSQVKIVNSFPKTASGKIQKYMLKKQIEQEYLLT